MFLQLLLQYPCDHNIAMESPIESRLPSTRRATIVALLVEGKRDSIGDSMAISYGKILSMIWFQ
jgi:hypothetical protein